MARQKSKLCPSCHTIFRGRSNSVTCSDRCRKRLQRAREHFYSLNTSTDPVAAAIIFNQPGRDYHASRR
jgi:uncharacterized paraquat-inducible protein A